MKVFRPSSAFCVSCLCENLSVPLVRKLWSGYALSVSIHTLHIFLSQGKFAALLFDYSVVRFFAILLWPFAGMS